MKSSWIALLGSVFSLSSAHSTQTAPVSNQKSQDIHKLEEKLIHSKKNFCVSYQSSSKNLVSNIDESFLADAELFVTYRPEVVPLVDISSLRLRWSLTLAESMTQAKLQTIKNSFNYFDVYTDGKHFAPSFLSIQLSCSLSDEREMVDYLENEIDRLLNEGISDQEFETARAGYLSYILDLLKDDKSEDEEFIYNCLSSEYEEEPSFLGFKEFLIASYEYLQNVTREDVSSVFPLYFSAENKVLESFSLKDFEGKEGVPASDESSESLEESFYSAYQSSTNEKASGFSSLKRGLSDQSAVSSLEMFNQLRLTDTDKRNIKKIVTTMADKNVFQLLLDKKTLEQKGKQVRPVHPMRFLGYICSDGHLRKCLHTISKNHFKWSSFVDGFKDRMKEEARKGELLPYVSGFAQTLNMDPNVVVNYINKSDYEGLMKHCI